MTARGLVNVFLFCIMAQIVEASSEVQASSGGTHCGEAEQSRARVTQRAFASSARTAVLCPLSGSSQLVTTEKQEVWVFFKEPQTIW